MISIVDDDLSVRRALSRLIRLAGYAVESFASAHEFLASGPGGRTACLVLDIQLDGRGMGGVLVQTVRGRSAALPHSEGNLPNLIQHSVSLLSPPAHSGERMDIDVTDSAGITVVAPQGDLDMAAADQVRQTLSKLVDDGSRKVLVDLAKVGYVDSMGLGALVASLKHVRTVGGDLHVCALQDDVRAIFEMTRLNKAVTIHGTRSEALGGWS